VRTSRWSRPLARLPALLLLALVCLAAAEVGARAFWRLSYGVPFRDPGRILYARYPELRSVDTQRPAHSDKFYDILLLGESVLHKNWGEVEQALREQLAAGGHRKVRVFNLARAAHTSRDSALKYAALGDARFEMVIVYHGINETRVNNAPADVFRDDYSHFSWYEVVNTLAPYHGTTSFALPYTLRYLAVSMRQALMANRYAPTHKPNEEWLRYGGDARSAVSFNHNLSAILDLAATRGDRAMLMTFATYVPDDYSFEAFKQKRLDYGLHLSPIEQWGRREHVLAAVAAHNQVVRNMLAEHDGLLFVDQAALMTASARYFNDPCHLTVDGSSKFVEHLLAVLLADLDQRER